MSKFIHSSLPIIGFLILVSLCLPGCWDVEEINRRGTANAIFLDKGQNHPVKMGASFHVPGTLLPPYNGAEQQFQKRNFTLTGEGAGLLDAFRDLQTNMTRAPFLGQLGAIVLSEEFATRNMADLLDFLGRRMEIPGNTFMLVNRSDPEKLMDLKTNTNILPGQYLQLYYEDTSRKFQSWPVRLWQIFTIIANETSDIYMPLIEPSQGQYKIEGLALFSNARMVGILDGNETTAVSLVKGGMKQGYLSVTFKEPHNNYLAGFFQVQSKSKIQPRLDSSGRLSFQIMVEISGNLRELQPRNVKIRVVDEKRYEQATAFYARQEIITVLHKLQSLDSDVIGFGNKVRVKYPRYWEHIDWHQVFPNVKFTVRTKFRNQNTGVLR